MNNNFCYKKKINFLSFYEQVILKLFHELVPLENHVKFSQCKSVARKYQRNKTNYISSANAALLIAAI